MKNQSKLIRKYSLLEFVKYVILKNLKKKKTKSSQQKYTKKYSREKYTYRFCSLS